MAIKMFLGVRHQWAYATVLAALALLMVTAVSVQAANPIDHAVQLTVTTQKSPPTITLNWPSRGNATAYAVYRRPSTGGGWVQIGTPVVTATSFADTNVTVGAKYEYKVQCTASDVTAYGYTLSGIEAPLVDDRGKIILLVDDTMTTPLQAELDRLVQDMAGDGWTVLRHNVARGSTTTQVKAIILADYQADPTNVKSALIFGHLAMYLSTNIAPDGHAARPWPTDQYYADMDLTWAASGTYYTPPGAVELQVGRVDLWNLPTFAPLTETDLLRRYLNKDHAYRMKQYAIQMKGFVCDNFGEFYGEAFAQSGWRNFSTFVGPSNISTGSWSNNSPPYLWGYGCGGGTYTSAAGVTDTGSLRTNDPAVFTFLFGSYFGQYDASDCLLRAELATQNYGLTCGWAGRPAWFVHHMALGETIGYSTLKTQNNNGTDYPPGYSGLQVDLMGDPTLRTFMVAPPGTATATPGEFGEVDLAWTASPDTVLGYQVYRASQTGGPYTRISTDIVTGLTFHDANPPVGQNYYMIRAVILQTTPSGSYYNPSQGSFASCIVPSSGIPQGGMLMWLKASTGVTKDGNGFVSYWADQSGAGNNVSQSTAALQPVLDLSAANGRPAVKFQGGGNVLQTSGLVAPADGPFSVLTFVSPTSIASPQTIYWQGGSSSTNGYGAGLTTPANLSASWGGSSAQITQTDPAAVGKWYLVSTTYDQSFHRMWVNGVSAGSAPKVDSNFNGGVFSIGNYGPAPTQGFNGDIAEVLVYNRALSDDERSSAERYLKYKYGRETPWFDMMPSVGLVPLTVNFDASGSVDPDGTIVSYVWDFGDHTSGTGVTTSHVYTAAGSYVATLTVTDNDGFSTQVTGNVTVMPAISSISLSSTPSSPIGIGTPVTLTGSVTGGYKVLYKFMINSGPGYRVLRDYGASGTLTWTPSKTGTYRILVYAKSADSANTDYDVVSGELTYIVATIPTAGLKLWLRADTGIGKDGSLVTTWADQSGSGNNVNQTNPMYKPTLIDNAVNSLPVVRFAGQSSVLQTSNAVLSPTGGHTSFTVARISSLPGTNYQYLWWAGSDSATGGYGDWITTSNKLRCGWGSSSSQLTFLATATVGDWMRLSARFDGTNQQAWLNGTSIGQNTKTNELLSSGFGVGNYAASAPYQGFYGDIAEILIYNMSLADTERQAVDSYLVRRWWPPVPVVVGGISQAKTLDDGTQVSFTTPKVVTVASGVFSDGSAYIEDPDRSNGIKVIGGTMALWDNVTLTGTIDTDANGESVIRVLSIDSQTPGSELKALGMLGGSIMTSGQLVRVWGRVTEKTATYFTLDDGSGSTVRIDTSKLATPLTVDVQVSSFAAVTGPIGYGPSTVVVQPRGDADVSVIAN